MNSTLAIAPSSSRFHGSIVVPDRHSPNVCQQKDYDAITASTRCHRPESFATADPRAAPVESMPAIHRSRHPPMSIRARAGWVMLLDQGIADNVGGDLSGAATPTIVLRTDTRSVALELGG